MRFSFLLTATAALASVSVPCAAQNPTGRGPIIPIVNGGEFQGGMHRRPGGDHGFRGIGGVWIVEREVPVYIEKEVVREVPAPPPAPSPEGEGKRKPYVIGNSYASLPGGCMKLIEEGASYYYCSGDWYRQVGSGSAISYKAVARRL